MAMSPIVGDSKTSNNVGESDDDDGPEQLSDLRQPISGL